MTNKHTNGTIISQILLLILLAFFAAGCIAPDEPGATDPPKHPEPDTSPAIDWMELAAPTPTATPHHIVDVNPTNETIPEEPEMSAAEMYAAGMYGSGGGGSSCPCGSSGCPPCDSCCPPCPPIPELPTSAALCVGIIGIFVARRWTKKT